MSAGSGSEADAPVSRNGDSAGPPADASAVAAASADAEEAERRRIQEEDDAMLARQLAEEERRMGAEFAAAAARQRPAAAQAPQAPRAKATSAPAAAKGAGGPQAQAKVAEPAQAQPSRRIPLPLPQPQTVAGVAPPPPSSSPPPQLQQQLPQGPPSAKLAVMPQPKPSPTLPRPVERGPAQPGAQPEGRGPQILQTAPKEEAAAAQAPDQRPGAKRQGRPAPENERSVGAPKPQDGRPAPAEQQAAAGSDAGPLHQPQIQGLTSPKSTTLSAEAPVFSPRFAALPAASSAETDRAGGPAESEGTGRSKKGRRGRGEGAAGGQKSESGTAPEQDAESRDGKAKRSLSTSNPEGAAGGQDASARPATSAPPAVPSPRVPLPLPNFGRPAAPPGPAASVGPVQPAPSIADTLDLRRLCYAYCRGACSQSLICPKGGVHAPLAAQAFRKLCRSFHLGCRLSAKCMRVHMSVPDALCAFEVHGRLPGDMDVVCTDKLRSFGAPAVCYKCASAAVLGQTRSSCKFPDCRRSKDPAHLNLAMKCAQQEVDEFLTWRKADIESRKTFGCAASRLCECCRS